MRAIFLCACLGAAVVSGVRLSDRADGLSTEEDFEFLEPVVFEGVEYNTKAEVVQKLRELYAKELSLLDDWTDAQSTSHKLRQREQFQVPDTIEGIIHQLNDTIHRHLRSRHSDAELEEGRRAMQQMQARASTGDTTKSTELEGSLQTKMDSAGPRKIKDIWSADNIDDSKNAKGYKYEGFGIGASLGGIKVPTPEELMAIFPKQFGPLSAYPQNADGSFKDFGRIEASDAYYLRLQNSFMQLDWDKATQAICHDPVMWATWVVYMQVAYVDAGNKAHAACQANKYDANMKAIDNVWQSKAKGAFNQRINWTEQNRLAAFKILNTVGYSREENVKQKYTPGGSQYVAEDEVYGSPWFQVVAPLLTGNGWMNVGNLLAASTN